MKTQGINYSLQGRIQDSPSEGAPTFQEGAPACKFASFSEKLHEIKKILVCRGGSWRGFPFWIRHWSVHPNTRVHTLSTQCTLYVICILCVPCTQCTVCICICWISTEPIIDLFSTQSTYVIYAPNLIGLSEILITASPPPMHPMDTFWPELT